MRVVVTGATGTIGVAVIAALRRRGDTVVALTRNPGRARSALSGVELHAWESPSTQQPPRAALARADAVVHLLGEPIAQRWTDTAKSEIRDSRILSTRMLVHGLRELSEADRPAVLVAQSATGYYGSCGDQLVDEEQPPGSDFLADVVVDWEREATAATADGVRVVITRTGVVLSPHGGALEKMLPPFRLGVGGPIAGGRQYIPWIHLDDVAGAIVHCIDTAAADGAVNVVAPHPVTNAGLSKVLGRVLHRPSFLPVPALALRALYGEMAVVVTGGVRASSSRLEALGYGFLHPELEPALRDVLADAA